MISRLLTVFFFWRRNNLPSIAFKCAFWAVLAWLAVGMFSDLGTASIAAAAAALVAAFRYASQFRAERAHLLKMVDGDRTKLAAMRERLSGGGMAGAMMTEMLRASMQEDEDDDELEEEEEVEVDAETRARNVALTTRLANAVGALCTERGYATAEHCAEALEALLAEHGDGETPADAEAVVREYLPDNVLDIFPEGFCDDDDHAALVEEFAAATNGRWTPLDCRSTHDETNDRWSVAFTDDGKAKTWRFRQSGDHLNGKFLEQLIAYVQSRSGHVVTVLEADEFPSVMLLPPDLAAVLDPESGRQAA